VLGLLVVAAACTPPPPQVSGAKAPGPIAAQPSGAPAAAQGAEQAPKCDVVCGAATVVSHEIPPSETADYYTNQAVDKANATLDGMHDDLLACYAARVKAYPKAHAFLTIDIVVGPDGHVQNVETQGGALLGAVAMKCIVDRIRGGEFASPPRGGTMRLEVPLTLRRVGPDETI